MNRSRRGRGTPGTEESKSSPGDFKSPLTQPPSEPPRASSIHTRAVTLAAALAVVLVPFLVAVFLSGSRADETPAKVTTILGSLDSKRSPRAGRPARAETDAPVAASVARGKSVPISFERGARTFIGRIEIPAIGLSTRYFEGVVDESVELGPGHWPGTPWPGSPGNSVFAGHRTTYTRPFADLDLLEPGDRIVAGVRNQGTTTYRVYKTTVIPEDEYVDFVLRQPQDKEARIITLFACTPKGQRTHRIVVQAKAAPAATGKPTEKEGSSLDRSS